MDGLDPAISYPHQCTNDAVPVSDYPMQMAGSSPAMTALAVRAVRKKLRPLVLPYGIEPDALAAWMLQSLPVQHSLGVLDRGVENLVPALLLCRISSVLRLPIVAFLHPLAACLMGADGGLAAGAIVEDRSASREAGQERDIRVALLVLQQLGGLGCANADPEAVGLTVTVTSLPFHATSNLHFVSASMLCPFSGSMVATSSNISQDRMSRVVGFIVTGILVVPR